MLCYSNGIGHKKTLKKVNAFGSCLTIVTVFLRVRQETEGKGRGRDCKGDGRRGKGEEGKEGGR